MKNNIKRPNTAKAQKIAENWNSLYPVGTPVKVRKDDKSILDTHTRSEAWVVCGIPVVLVRGISGGYALDRVSPN